jgi:hypothetical protein
MATICRIFLLGRLILMATTTQPAPAQDEVGHSTPPASEIRQVAVGAADARKKALVVPATVVGRTAVEAKERDHPAKLAVVPSFPTSPRILTTMNLIRTDWTR